MKILLIMTGGTIGSAFDGGSIDVRPDGRSAVVDRYTAEHSDVLFDTVNPLNILSERVSADDFNILAKALYDIDDSNYDGVIVTAGSDTLAYLSAFVGLVLGGCALPVMIVAANKILTAPDSNGYENFCCAVELIKKGLRGVFVPYRNSDGTFTVRPTCAKRTYPRISLACTERTACMRTADSLQSAPISDSGSPRCSARRTCRISAITCSC